MRLNSYSVGDILIYDPAYIVHRDNPWAQNIGLRFEVLRRTSDGTIEVQHLPTEGRELQLQVGNRTYNGTFTFRDAAFILDTTREPDWEV